MRRTMMLSALAALLAVPALQAQQLPEAVARAVADPARQADAVKDAQRKAGPIMVFAEVKPGQRVLELIPGGGYFTRVFSSMVGRRGHVYLLWPNEYLKVEPGAEKANQALAADPYYANLTVLQQPAAQLSVPEKVDLVFTSQNYHDYPDRFMGPVDPAVLNRQVFDVLKPGGLFVVIDHVAPAGSGMADTDTLHRIDPAIVKAQVEAAGFVFDGQSELLANPADPHTAKVFDPAIRGHTDQFIYRFRKPLH